MSATYSQELRVHINLHIERDRERERSKWDKMLTLGHPGKEYIRTLCTVFVTFL